MMIRCMCPPGKEAVIGAMCCKSGAIVTYGEKYAKLWLLEGGKLTVTNSTSTTTVADSTTTASLNCTTAALIAPLKLTKLMGMDNSQFKNAYSTPALILPLAPPRLR